MADAADRSVRAVRERLDLEERQLQELETQANEARARIRAQRDEISAQTTRPEEGRLARGFEATKRELTSAEKLDLFRRRFRGRLDVFARRWSNPRTGCLARSFLDSGSLRGMAPSRGERDAEAERVVGRGAGAGGAVAAAQGGAGGGVVAST